MSRRQDDAVDASIDGVFDNINLRGIVNLVLGTFPHDVDAGFFSGSLGPGMNALPEEMRSPFWNNRDDALAARGLTATGEPENRKRRDDD